MNKMIKKIAAAAFLLGVLLCFGLAKVLGENTIATALVLHTLLIINLLGLSYIWRVVFQQKSVALGVVIIILKYPLLGITVFLMSKQKWYYSLGMLNGFLSFLIAVVGVALILQVLDKKRT